MKRTDACFSLAVGVFALGLFAWACARIAVTETSAHPEERKQGPTDRCEMVAKALRETVRTFDEQPFGLERACVEKLASPDGRIYVDVTFTGTASLDSSSETDCTRDAYVIRFDNRRPAPTADVVLFIVFDRTPDGHKFNARIETADWHQQKPGVMTLSQCGSAYGLVRRESTGWRATVTKPPRSADAL